MTPRPWWLRVPYPSRNQEEMALPSLFPVCHFPPCTVSIYGSVFQTRTLFTDQGDCLREVAPLTPARRLGPGRRSRFNQPIPCAFAVPHALTTNLYFDSNRHLSGTCSWCAQGQSRHWLLHGHGLFTCHGLRRLQNLYHYGFCRFHEDFLREAQCQYLNGGRRRWAGPTTTAVLKAGAKRARRDSPQFLQPSVMVIRTLSRRNKKDQTRLGYGPWSPHNIVGAILPCFLITVSRKRLAPTS